MSSIASNSDRRAFLARLVKTGLLATATGMAGFKLYDGIGPSPSSADQAALALPEYAIHDPSKSEQQKRLAVVHGSDRKQTLSRGLTALGGIEAFVKKGEHVLIKVNAAFATPPALSATTHPDLVTELVRFCLKAGAAEVRVADNPINDPATCFELTGIGPAARAAGARVMLPRATSFQPVSVSEGRLIKNWPVFVEPLKGVDKVIGIAPVKDHHRSGASLSMKNWYGLLGGRRNIFHQEIHGIIFELALMIRPTLVILDGTTTMMTNGPTGGSLADLKQTDTMILGTDPVAVDTYGAGLLEKSIDTLPFIAKAEAAGLGTTDLDGLDPVVQHLG